MKLNSGFETKKARVEMLPLIDVVFLLLVFFIYAFLSMAVHHGLKVDLPRAGQAALETRELLVITIQADNQLFLNKEPVTADSLIPRIRALQTEADLPVFINGDQAAGLGTAVQILDLLQTAGIEKVSFACAPEQP